MIGFRTIPRLLLSIGMSVTLVIPATSLAAAQASCRMVCANQKQGCRSCCADDLSCGVSKSPSDAPHPVTATQPPGSPGTFSQAVLTRTVLFILPFTAERRPESVAQARRQPPDYLATNCILLI
jgi:hypothetical protein